MKAWDMFEDSGELPSESIGLKCYDAEIKGNPYMYVGSAPAQRPCIFCTIDSHQ